jgi:hypothetical protein
MKMYPKKKRKALFAEGISRLMAGNALKYIQRAIQSQNRKNFLQSSWSCQDILWVDY